MKFVPTLEDAIEYERRQDEHKRRWAQYLDAAQDAKARALQAWIDSPDYQRIMEQQKALEECRKQAVEAQRIEREQVEARAASYAEKQRLAYLRQREVAALRDRERKLEKAQRAAERAKQRTSPERHRQRHSRIDWAAIVDDTADHVVSRQEGYERNQAVLTLHKAGLTYAAIAKRFGVCTARAQQMANKAAYLNNSRRPAPIEQHLEQWSPRALVLDMPRDKLRRLAQTLDVFAYTPKHDWLLVASGKLASGDWRAP